MSFAHLVGASGGLVYHLRALRRREAAWAPFRDVLGVRLDAWAARVAPEVEGLVIVGSSAGHCLHAGALARFSRLAIVEPDPLARFLFRRRYGPAEHVDLDFLVGGTTASRDAALDALLTRFPRAAILFSNVLGQLSVLRDEDDDDASFTRDKAHLREALRGRRWMTFHDRFSGALAPRPDVPRRFDHRASDDELLAAFYEGGAGELVDHSTEGLTDPQRPHEYLVWTLDAAQHHVIELWSSD